jgi:hypothetical protein
MVEEDGRQHRSHPPHFSNNVLPLAALFVACPRWFKFAGRYGANATMWTARWRGFYLACAELFDYDGGNEWYVSHYLFRKRC